MSGWLVALVVGAATVALKGGGPVLLGGRGPREAGDGPSGLLAPALLAALVVTQTVGSGGRLVLDARLLGVAAAAAALALRAPLVVVTLVAALVAALVRLL